MWREIENFKFNTSGIKVLQKTPQGKRLVIDSISVFGWCQADINNIFSFYIEAYTGGKWVILFGLQKISNSDFECCAISRDQIKCDMGNDSDARLRVRIDNRISKDFEVNIILVYINNH